MAQLLSIVERRAADKERGNRCNDAKSAIFNAISCEINDAKAKLPAGKKLLPHGFVRDLVVKYRSLGLKFVTRDSVNKMVSRKMISNNAVVESTSETTQCNEERQIGRPKHKTDANAKELRAKKKEMLHKITCAIVDLKSKTGNKKKASPGAIKKIISSIKKDFNLETTEISMSTIYSRIRRGNFNSGKNCPKSPLHDVEDLFVGTKDLSQFLTCSNKEKWTDPIEWSNAIPDLSISDNATCENTSIAINTETSVRNIIEDGYTLIDNNNSSSIETKNSEAVVNGITRLHKMNLPATFILLFDQAWQLAANGNTILSQSTHADNRFNFDVLAWYIDPSENMSGFSPHRDRQPTNAEVANSFHKDGQAKYVTLWMALSNATPENSCLYVIPKQFDPGYLKGDDDDDDDVDNDDCDQEDPLSRALQTKESYQNIRALPRQPGECIAFTHRILHWGSKGNKNCTEPRIAISFVSSDPTFEKPYLRNCNQYWNNNPNNSKEEGNKLPPFRMRLLLVCAQLLIYYQRFDLPKETIRACYEYCKENCDELDDAYWKKVSLEFVKVMKEEKINAAEKSDKEEDDDEQEESLLEAMLENADGGDFSDDYDEFGGNNEATEDGEDEFDSDEEEEDEECNLFRGDVPDEPETKRQKKE